VKAEPVYQDGLINWTKWVWKVGKRRLEKNPWLDLGSLKPAAIWFTLECLHYTLGTCIYSTAMKSTILVVCTCNVHIYIKMSILLFIKNGVLYIIVYNTKHSSSACCFTTQSWRQCTQFKNVSVKGRSLWMLTSHLAGWTYANKMTLYRFIWWILHANVQ